MVIKSALRVSGLVRHTGFIIKSKLWAQIVFAMVLGVAFGAALSPQGGALISESSAMVAAEWIGLPGKLFLGLIQMVVVPLVITSIVLGIASGGNTSDIGKIGGYSVPFFVATTAIATAIGIILALWIQPGGYVDSELVRSVSSAPEVVKEVSNEEKMIPQMLEAMFPKNPSAAILNKNMFQIVIFSVLMGVAIASIDRKKMQPLLDVANGGLEVSLTVVNWAMMLVPYAVFGLLAQVTIKTGLEVMLSVSVYIGTVLLGLLLMIFVYLLIVMIIGGRRPIEFWGMIKDVQLLAFSTSSSAATMPLTMRTGEEVLRLPASIVRFVVPLGATINMAGTALYQVVATVFLTQVFGNELSMGELVVLSITVIGASIGSPSTPGAGIVILATILSNMGVPAEGIAIVIGVDRIIDMSRTSVNVTGDLVACVVTDKLLNKDKSDSAAEGGDAIERASEATEAVAAEVRVTDGG